MASRCTEGYHGGPRVTMMVLGRKEVILRVTSDTRVTMTAWILAECKHGRRISRRLWVVGYDRSLW